VKETVVLTSAAHILTKNQVLVWPLRKDEKKQLAKGHVESRGKNFKLLMKSLIKI
jgi:hypothetical protein